MYHHRCNRTAANLFVVIAQVLGPQTLAQVLEGLLHVAQLKGRGGVDRSSCHSRAPNPAAAAAAVEGVLDLRGDPSLVQAAQQIQRAPLQVGQPLAAHQHLDVLREELVVA